MNALIIYDSMYGNTDTIARAIAEGITCNVKIIKADNAGLSDMNNVNFLIIGSPTQGGRYTKTIEAFLNDISGKIQKGTNIAVFDTRMPSTWVKIFGFAASKLADFFKKEGFDTVVEPAFFMVQSSKGPLVTGECEKAVLWGENLCRATNS